MEGYLNRVILVKHSTYIRPSRDRPIDLYIKSCHKKARKILQNKEIFYEAGLFKWQTRVTNIMNKTYVSWIFWLRSR